MQSKKNEVWVGLFVLIAIAAIIFPALKVADIRSVGSEKTYGSLPPLMISAASRPVLR